MKQKNAIYLVVAFAAFAIFSCSKEEIIDLDNNAPGQKAVISIKVVGAGNNLAQSRAAGAAAIIGGSTGGRVRQPGHHSGCHRSPGL